MSVLLEVQALGASEVRKMVGLSGHVEHCMLMATGPRMMADFLRV